MKKAIVLLLALAVLGGAVFAQDAPAVSVAAAVFGEVGVYNNGTDTTVGSNNGFDLDIDASSDVIGISAELEYTQPTETVYFNYAYAWYKPFEMVKINAGYLALYSRLRNSMSNTLGGGAMEANGLAVEVTPVEGLSLIAFVPVAADKSFVTGAPAYAKLIADTAKELDFFAKYTMADVGAFYTSYQMADADSKFNFAADIKLIPDVKLQAGVTYAGIGKAATVGQDLTGNLVLGYTMDALTLTEEANIYSNSAAPELKAFGWLSNTIVAYRLGDVRFQATVNVANKRLLADDYLNYSVEPAVRFYAGSNYFNVAFKYSADTLTGTKPTWKIPVAYFVSF